MPKKPKNDAPSTPPAPDQAAEPAADLEGDAIPQPTSVAPPAETEPAERPAPVPAADLDEFEQLKADVAELRKQVLVLGRCMSAIVRDPSESSMDQGLANKIRNALAIANF